MNAFYPIDETTLDIALAQFSKVSGLLMTVVGTVMIARFVLVLIQVGDAGGYSTVLKDVVTYLIAINLYAPVLKIFMESLASLSSQIVVPEAEPPPGTLSAYFHLMEDKAPWISIMTDLGSSSVLHIAQAIYSVLLALLIAIAPVVIFIAILLHGVGVRGYVTAICALSLWPLTWNLLACLASETAKGSESTSLGQFCFWAVVHLLQLLSPIFSVFLFKTLATGEAFHKPTAAAQAALKFSNRKKGSQS